MSEHKTEQRPWQHTENFCLEEGCEFNGERAQQGVCYSREKDVIDDSKLDKMTEELEEDLKRMKEQLGEDYESAVESCYVCAQLNWSLMLDQVIALRVENRRLKKKLKWWEDNV